jgi:AcrR family transcriptional regulator
MQLTTVSPSAKRPTAVGRPRRLRRAQIAAVALEIVDRDGLDRLSMRRVAEALGVGTMTLYGYFRDKDELLDAVVDAAVGHERPTLSGSWREQLRQLARVAHQNLTAHPALVEIRFGQPVLRPEALRFGEAGMGILRAAGFASHEAARAFRLLFTYTLGFAGLSPVARLDEARQQAGVAIAGLAADEYPNLRETAAEFSAAIGGQDAFEYGLERILDGLEASLHSSSSDPES